jgi:golgi apyrase
MLHEGIGVPRVGLEKGHETLDGHANKTNAIIDEAEDRGFLDPFQAVNKIDGTDVSWTLGKMVLYASSQMPPAKDAMAVGFGSNVPGPDLPDDFQFASGKAPVSVAEPEESTDWHDRLLGSSYSRRIPGLLIFLLILALAMYLLCGRERRSSIWARVTGRRPSPSRARKRRNGGNGIFSGKLFGSNEQSYERVVEEAADPDEFELSDVHSDEQHHSDSSTSSHGRTGRSSGWATPATRGLSPDVARASPKKGIFDASTGGGAGLGITPFDRGGLTVRTESRERLAPAPTQLGRGRTGSPRRSPLISPLKESVD